MNKRTWQKGFSLIEVTLALGVVGFALTAMIGLMPIGLTSLRSSMESSARADILRQLTSQFQETPFDSLTSSSAMLYYSDEGVPLDRSDGAFLGVTYEVCTNTPLLKDSSYNNSHLKAVKILFWTQADRAKVASAASMTNVVFVSPGIK